MRRQLLPVGVLTKIEMIALDSDACSIVSLNTFLNESMSTLNLNFDLELSTYGRLIPLFQSKCDFHSKAETLTLSRQSAPNGLAVNQITLPMTKALTTCMVASKAADYDLFQIPPALKSKSKAPEFRLLMDRRTAFVRIFAGRLTKGSLEISMSSLSFENNCIDSLKPFVLLFTPSTGKWATISVLGKSYVSGKLSGSNILEHNSIICSSGLAYQYKSYLEPEAPLSLEVTCPVTLDLIPTTHISNPLTSCKCRSFLGKISRLFKNRVSTLRPFYYSGCG